jgi:hypothetical protein
MEINIDVIHVDNDGDRPIKLTFNDINKNLTINMYLNGEHYRVNLDQLERVIKAIK